MPINKNHEFEDLEGVKCAIVEKNVSSERVEFLKNLLEYNRYKVVVVKSPPPKVVAAPAAAVPTTAESATAISPDNNPPMPPSPSLPETFTIGVTDVTFNSTNAIFGRLLHSPDGHVVTLAYWEQQEKESNDEIPYFENG